MATIKQRTFRYNDMFVNEINICCFMYESFKQIPLTLLCPKRHAITREGVLCDLEILPRLSAIFLQANNFRDFMFASIDNKATNALPGTEFVHECKITA